MARENCAKKKKSLSATRRLDRGGGSPLLKRRVFGADPDGRTRFIIGYYRSSSDERRTPFVGEFSNNCARALGEERTNADGTPTLLQCHFRRFFVFLLLFFFALPVTGYRCYRVPAALEIVVGHRTRTRRLLFPGRFSDVPRVRVACPSNRDPADRPDDSYYGPPPNRPENNDKAEKYANVSRDPRRVKNKGTTECEIWENVYSAMLLTPPPLKNETKTGDRFSRWPRENPLPFLPRRNSPFHVTHPVTTWIPTFVYRTATVCFLFF